LSRTCCDHINAEDHPDRAADWQVLHQEMHLVWHRLLNMLEARTGGGRA
jgi:predicted NodU family carbamoyl transferase